MLKANALKLLIVLLYTPFALVVFIYHNQVHYGYGMILAAGSMLGAWMASKMALKKGAAFIRYVVLIAIFFSALKLIGIY